MVFVVTDENKTKKPRRVGEIARVVHLSCPTGFKVHDLKDIVLSITPSPVIGAFIDIESVESSLKISHLSRGSW